jgi:hypothetical protein
MRRACLRSLIAVALLAPFLAQGETDAQPAAVLTAPAIMARVPANQDRSQSERRRYVYLQHVRAVSRKPGGRLMCEEVTDARVSPEAAQSHQQLISLQGRYWHDHGYVAYTQLPKDDEDDGMDRDLVENLRKNLTDDNSAESRDGFATGLFPLTTKQQGNYRFTLLGRERLNGRDVYHLRFVPADKSDYHWEGDAFIDAREFQPVVVYTQLSRKLPIFVRTLLGTNVPGLGFTVTYARQPDGLWFPQSFGTEFRMRVLFFITRDLSISLDNSHFEKTHAEARILDGFSPAVAAPGP